MTCIRCGREDEVGFCIKCYNEIYGLVWNDPIMMNINDLVCNEKHLTLVERDWGYTDEIRQSIIKDGLKNPLIIDIKNRILIGHHRYFIYKEMGWEKIPCYVVKDNNLYNKFIEHGTNNLFILKIDGKLNASVTRLDEIITFIDNWLAETPSWKTSYLSLEAFTGLGSTGKKN